MFLIVIYNSVVLLGMARLLSSQGPGGSPIARSKRTATEVIPLIIEVVNDVNVLFGEVSLESGVVAMLVSSEGLIGRASSDKGLIWFGQFPSNRVEKPAWVPSSHY